MLEPPVTPIRKANDGLELPATGFGTYKVNGLAGVDAIKSAIHQGYRLIDSAFNYENEGVVGRAIRESALGAGAREVFLIEEPMAAAIGAGLPVEEATGNMVVDIGGGTTEIAVISLGGIVTSRSIRIGGDEMDSSIVQYIKRMYNLMIGERTAEEIKINIGTAIVTPETDTSMDIRGRDLVSGLPKTITIQAKEIREALGEPIYKIVDAVKATLEKTPPELAADVMDHGIMMTGGGALLTNLDQLLSHETGMPVLVSEDALSCVGEGTGKSLENIELLKRVVMTTKKLRQ